MTAHPDPVCPRQRGLLAGFTLIELLVVISIIALLIAILLPALGAARESARNSQCLSNTRQMMVAISAYLTDNGGWYPRAWNQERDADNPPADQTEIRDLWVGELIATGYTTTSELIRCPVFDRSRLAAITELFADIDSDTIGDARALDYGVNINHIFGSRRAGTTGNDRYNITSRVEDIAQPSATIAGSDSVRDSTLTGAGVDPYGSYQIYDYEYAAPPSGGAGMPHARHQNQSLSVFWLDGHAGAEQVEELFNPWADLSSGVQVGAVENTWDRF